MKRHILSSLLCFFSSVLAAAAQTSPAGVTEAEGIPWLPMIAGVAIGFGIAVFFWLKSKKGEDKPEFNYKSRYSKYHENSSYNAEDVDAEMEMEWLRKAKASTAGPAKGGASGKNKRRASKTSVPGEADETEDLNFDTKIFQEKMRKLQYAELPINSFIELRAPRLYEPLPLSNDESLINAIDQAHEEFEEDEAVREIAIRVLAAFRMRNAVEALSQIALYDLSANLRSKAVVVLTEFDHESVFETILLACADPTREVRAAAARGLFRLNFDRTDSWTRIIDTNDEFRMSHAARAAVESGIVVKSFDRLIHEEVRIAYEAFALVTLLIRSGETGEVFNVLRTHRDERVRFALLHVLKVTRDPRTLDQLAKVHEEGGLPGDVAKRLSETICTFDAVAA